MLVRFLKAAVLALLVGLARQEIRISRAERNISRRVLDIYNLHPGQIEELEKAISRCLLVITSEPYRVLVNSGAALEIGVPSSDNLCLVAENDSVKIFSSAKTNKNQARFLRMVANAIQSWSKQCEYSHKDQITGVGNRKGIAQALNRIFKLAERTASPFSILLLDIDGFKQFNDKHGHSHGDQVLMQVAQRVSKRIRETDAVGRYGNGDEFLVILPATTQEDAVNLAEEIREDVKAEGITLSIGVASCYPEHALTLDDLLERADKALYTAKEGGKNRVAQATI